MKPDLFKIILTGILIIGLLAVFIIFFILLYRKSYKKSIAEKELMQVQFSQTLLQTQLEIQQQTLQHVSRELHDNLGQVASLIKIHLNTLRFDDLEKASISIETTKDLTRQLIADIKSLSVSLNSDRIARVGLINALQTETQRLNKTNEFVASIEVLGTALLENDKAVILYRMSQEILNNMIKHSKASHINILCDCRENRFILAFSDDGIGFNVTDKINNDGAGLNNLLNRAKQINAELTMQSTVGKGSRVTIVLPL
ncbi:MAG: ATP-binding protein [Ferruginibacter sp.]